MLLQKHSKKQNKYNFWGKFKLAMGRLYFIIICKRFPTIKDFLVTISNLKPFSYGITSIGTRKS